MKQTHPTFAKICGIRDVMTALIAADAGAAAIGLVFYAPSPRAVSLETAASIVAALPPHVKAVALCVNASTNEVRQIIQQVKPHILQFHGDEDALFCGQFGIPYWKAIRVNAATDLLNLSLVFASATRLLLDADKSGLYGGSGDTFDWQLIPTAMRSQIILSGGLNPNNVADAIKQINPWGVDVSSGVEESKGVKNEQLIRQFMKEVSREHV
jgi:phosphoribosylanthranilate isomerase